ncbi:MAG: type secretion system protein ImpH [Acidobacteriota bacterium]|jgi:type VI secretion system protein ImpH|nr:type secretion system protein ImpH [Acidobacteriota bacterium]
MTVQDPVAAAHQSLEEELFSNADRFTFLQAVRLLELIGGPNRTAPGEGVDPHRELVLFRQYVGFDFPPADVEFLVPPRHKHEPAKMSVNVLGLTGAHGPLPHHITDLLLERTGRGDRGLRDFLDIFNHRLISLLYRARKKYRPPLDAKGPSNGRVAGVLLSFLGLGTGHLLNRLRIPDRSLLPYTGLFTEQFRSPIGLERAVEDCFGVGAKVVQFQGVWHELEESDLTRIGVRGRNHALGHGALLGRRVYDPTANFELRLGPMPYARFVSFLPHTCRHSPHMTPHSYGDAFQPLRSLVRFYAREELGFSVRLEVAKEEVPQLRISRTGSALLGWTSWLKTRDAQHDDSQVSVSGSRG